VPAADGGVAVAATDDDQEYVIEDVSVEAEPGETVAFVGSTGAGKSTLCRLLLRLYDLNEGSVKVDGTDVRELELASLRTHVGYVSQDAFLFDGTIGDNIRYGRFEGEHGRRSRRGPGGRGPRVHLRVAGRLRHPRRRTRRQTLRGQRQRIAIARVVLQDPAILVLDEATSDVDTDTEQRIQSSLDALTEDRTTFVVAHRLSTVVGADQIVVPKTARSSSGAPTRNSSIAAAGTQLWGAQTGSA